MVVNVAPEGAGAASVGNGGHGINASKAATDEWWADRLVDESAKKSLIDSATLESTPAAVSTPSRDMCVRKRTSNPKHMTTSQLKNGLREKGIDIPDGVTRENLQQMHAQFCSS